MNHADVPCLSAVLGDYGHVTPFKEHAMPIPGFALAYQEAVSAQVFRRMLAERPEFDICEVAFGPYLLARSMDKPVSAVPVVLTRDFQHSLMAYHKKSGIRGPADLEGKRVGCRFYCQTSAIWARGILGAEYGLDLSHVTWVVAEEEPVEGTPRYPDNVQRGSGTTLAQMLKAGEVDAAVGANLQGLSEVEPLIPNAPAAEAEWYERTGVYPVNHTLVVRNSLLVSYPRSGQALYTALKTAKAQYLGSLQSQGAATSEDQLRLRQQLIVGGDPLPYGVEDNRKAVETLIRWAWEQGVIPREFAVEELFVSDTLDVG